MNVIQTTKNRQSNHIQVRSTGFKPKLAYYANLDRTTISNIVNQALEQYIANREKNSKPRNPLAHWEGCGQSNAEKDEFEKLTQYLQDNKTVANREYDFS